MHQPFGFDHNLSGNLHRVLVVLDDDLLLFIHTPSPIPFDIPVNAGPVVDSPLPPGDQLYFFAVGNGLLSTLDLLQVGSMLLSVDVVGHFVASEGKCGSEDESHYWLYLINLYMVSGVT